jgi:hypothetical protein
VLLVTLLPLVREDVPYRRLGLRERAIVRPAPMLPLVVSE